MTTTIALVALIFLILFVIWFLKAKQLEKSLLLKDAEMFRLQQ